jgi:RNA recognition motif-containing protein
MSNPERKKERTDQDANEKEVFVAGLSKFTTQADLEKLFKTVRSLSLGFNALSYDRLLYAQYGGMKEVRMATDDDGSAKGFAFVEFEAEVHTMTLWSCYLYLTPDYRRMLWQPWKQTTTN